MDGGEIGEMHLAALARAQHGVVTTRQLEAAGIGHRGIAHRVRHGRLTRLHRGVYRVGPLAAPFELEMAALLACGAGAALSHHSAAAVWGLRPPHEGDVHVTTTQRSVGSRPGIQVHYTASLNAAVHNGLSLTMPARTLQDIATTLSPHDLERAVEEALVQRLTTVADLARARGRGAARLRAAVPGEPTLTRSEAERRLLELIRAARLPRPRTNVRVAGWEVDFFWPEHNLVVEVDGYAYHGSRHAFERDRRRDADLVAAGQRVVRVTWRQLAGDALALVARLAALTQPSARPYWRS